ncbi:Piso0_002332 [Millerozyma farinosa CBS 7064]|uniref:General transcription and DNA repair factor IIH subunit TFB4 n=1 Tax=Pichia sorbitophila (strain ATCC MYA-4447 / BCRC 22081 / CBS 7064 / NBRC 10061 / NRRL Y-12695) TaxID=559304 RepID=G8YCB9_PICSO|nr:Piso0_002332 [Millerozyma farinosa CBS 7064]
MDAVSETIITDQKPTQPTVDDPSLLTVILDLTPHGWFKIKHHITVQEVTKALLVFLNAHLSLNNSNQVAFIVCSPDGAKFLYPNPGKNFDGIQDNGSSKGETGNKSSNPNLVNTEMYRQFRIVDEAVLEELNEVLKSLSKSNSVNKTRSTLSGALSLALTYTNRMLNLDQSISTTTASAFNATTKSTSGTSNVTSSGSSASAVSTNYTSMLSRILVISANDDDDVKYIPIMNSMFAAQKMRLPIDVAKLGSISSSYLQQASDATNGIYLQVEKPEGLIQTLCTAFFIESSIRPLIILPSNSNVSYRASCFITGKSVDLGYVCSVCLCIMSIIPTDAKCPTCNSHFDKSILNQLQNSVVLSTKRRKIDSNGRDTPPV